MQRSVLWILILAVFAAGAVWAAPAPIGRNVRQGPVILTGLEDTPFDGVTLPRTPPVGSLDDPIVPLHQAGTTWYDNQQNGTAGKQIAVDRNGFVHVVWTNGLNSGSSSRHVFYNVWDPQSGSFQLPTAGDTTGLQVDGAPRGGYVTVDVNDEGFAFPTFHQGTADEPHSAVGLDFYPGLGGFMIFEIPHLAGNQQIIWPKVACDINGNVQTVHTETGGAGLDYYARGQVWIHDGVGDSITWPVGFEEWLPAWFITMDVAASPVSQRVAVAWIDEPAGDSLYTDVWLRISEDAGQNWQDPINVTNFLPLDTNCVTNGGTPQVCNGDTMRPWLDLSILIDDDDVVHIGFSCSGYYWWDDDGNVLTNHGFVFSNLWHWDSQHNEYTIIHEAWYSHTSVALGVNNLMCDRPNLAYDTTTGYLYCSFHKFDSVQVSAGGYPQGDAYITVSTDRGIRWAEATDVSNTDGGVDTPAGQCLAERDIFIAKNVTDGIVHMEYMLDRDAGTAIVTTPEGIPTLNPIYYLRIPVDMIPTTPIINPLRNLRVDSTGFPYELLLAADDHPNPLPEEFTLYQNYPNPFNPTTNIQFDLATQSEVSLKVFDVQGREMARIMDNQRLAAGAHTYSFDGSAFASGIYFYRLETPSSSQTRKMVLMK